MPAEERDLMLDPALKLQTIRELHARGRAAEREYYICSIADAAERAALRRELGVELRTAAGRAAFLITVECLRADHLSCNGYGRPTTPGIDALAGTGVNFPRAYATAGDTAQAAPGLLMSTLYQNFGASRRIPPGVTTLAEALRAAGFHTLGFNAGQAQASRFYGYARGFDEFSDFIVPQATPENTFVDHTYRRLNPLTEQDLAAIVEDCHRHPDIYKVLVELTGYRGMELAQRLGQCGRFYPYTAADLVRCALYSLLEDADGRDRFYWLHMMDVHENITVPWSPLGVFAPVEQYLLNQCASTVAGRRALGARAEKYHQLYDSAVAYVDANVQVLANFLADLGLIERSLVCVTADHGQELLEQGVFGHSTDRMADGLVHVPLVFGGGLAAGLERASAGRPVSVLDVAPSILDLCGVAGVPESFLGVTLNDTAPRPVCGQGFYDGAEHLIPDGRRLFRLWPFSAPVRECCREVYYDVEGAWQVVRDVGRNTTRLVRQAPSPEASPPADRLARRARQWLDAAYLPPVQERQVG
jgi:arylsulfatase A-like enzyme